jgi:hypothetical protein
MTNIEQVNEYVTKLETTCPRGDPDGTPYAILGTSDGDACLFNGMLASVWPAFQTNWPAIAVSCCQATHGRWYRSPRLDESQPGFSRDMAMGVLLTMSTNSLTRMDAVPWLDYIDSRGEKPCIMKAFGKCILKSPKKIYSFSPGDDRTKITPEVWSLMNRVWEFRGWDDIRHDEMATWRDMDGDVAVLEAENTKLGYTLHLKAVQAFIKYLIGQSREYSIKVGKICYERQPSNLFYRFLATRVIDDKFVDDFLEQCPHPESRWGNVWLWQVAHPEDEYIDSCGWDWVFIGKLILKYYGVQEWSE